MVSTTPKKKKSRGSLAHVLSAAVAAGASPAINVPDTAPPPIHKPHTIDVEYVDGMIVSSWKFPGRVRDRMLEKFGRGGKLEAPKASWKRSAARDVLSAAASDDATASVVKRENMAEALRDAVPDDMEVGSVKAEDDDKADESASMRYQSSRPDAVQSSAAPEAAPSAHAPAAAALGSDSAAAQRSHKLQAADGQRVDPGTATNPITLVDDSDDEGGRMAQEVAGASKLGPGPTHYAVPPAMQRMAHDPASAPSCASTPLWYHRQQGMGAMDARPGVPHHGAPPPFVSAGGAPPMHVPNRGPPWQHAMHGPGGHNNAHSGYGPLAAPTAHGPARPPVPGGYPCYYMPAQQPSVPSYYHQAHAPPPHAYAHQPPTDAYGRDYYGHRLMPGYHPREQQGYNSGSRNDGRYPARQMGPPNVPPPGGAPPAATATVNQDGKITVRVRCDASLMTEAERNQAVLAALAVARPDVLASNQPFLYELRQTGH